jgi:hypothetical protein
MRYVTTPGQLACWLVMAATSVCPQLRADTLIYSEPASSPDWAKPIEIHYKGLSLQAILKDISDRYGVSVLADGAPVLGKTTIDFKGTLRDSLDIVADAFDYAVSVHKSGIVSLMKKFNDPDDLPQLVPAEIRQTAADMLAILPDQPSDTSDPPLLWASWLRQLARRLPADILDGMKNGKSYAFSDLTPDIQRSLADVLAWRAFGVARSAWDRLYRQLDRFEQSTLHAKKKGAFIAADTGKTTTSYSVLHQANGVNGAVIETELGIFQREEIK